MKKQGKPQVNMQMNFSKEDMEDIVAAAIIKAKAEIEEGEKKREKRNMISYTIRSVLVITFAIFALVLIVSAVMCIASFILRGSAYLKDLYQYSIFVRLFILFMSLTYGAWFGAMAYTVAKEYDRNYLISFASTIISIIALVAALSQK